MNLRMLAVGLLMVAAACTSVNTPEPPGSPRPAAGTPRPDPPAITSSAGPSAVPETPGLVEVVLRSAADSPGTAFFAVYNAAGDRVYQTTGSLSRSDTLHLPPGEYRWTANAPIPTPPLGCYNIFENYGFSQEGRFTAVKDPIRVEVRIGFRLLMCTSTPMGT